MQLAIIIKFMVFVILHFIGFMVTLCVICKCKVNNYLKFNCVAIDKYVLQTMCCNQYFGVLPQSEVLLEL